MTVTNETLIWLAPLAGAVAMTVTTLVTIWFEKRGDRNARKEVASPTSPATAASFTLAAEAAHAALDAVFKNAPPGMFADVQDTAKETKVRTPESSRQP